MAGFLDTVKILIIPLSIAVALYAALAYVALPLIRNYRNRYDQYLPLDAISERTSGLRARIVDSIFSRIIPSLRRRRDVETSGYPRESSSGDELAFGEEEGESMVGFDVSRRDRSIRGGNVEVHSDRRLSRDLEEGFKDDSEDDSEDDRRR